MQILLEACIPFRVVCEQKKKLIVEGNTELDRMEDSSVKTANPSTFPCGCKT